MFPAATLVGIQTRAVRGLFAPREALERMVAGTNLVIVPNAVTGVIAVMRRGESGPIVELPPFIVTQAPVGLHWLHAVIPGFEILSCCPSGETDKFVGEIHRQQACLDEILPSDLQGDSAVPIHLLLLSNEIQRAISKDVATLITGTSPVAGLIPQIKLWDEDSVAIDVVLEHRDEGEYRGIGYTPNYLYFLLGRRVPRLPLWFIEGVVNLYENLCWQDERASIPAATGRSWQNPWLQKTATFRASHIFGIAAVDYFTDDNPPPPWIPPLRPESMEGAPETTRPSPKCMPN